jgi:hypothetical protein
MRKKERDRSFSIGEVGESSSGIIFPGHHGIKGRNAVMALVRKWSALPRM